MTLTITKKFRQNPDSWLNAAWALFEVDLNEKAKTILNRALTTLPERDRKYFLCSIQERIIYAHFFYICRYKCYQPFCDHV